MKFKVDRGEKVIKIGFVEGGKEEHVQRWTFIQIYQPTKSRFLNEIPKEQNNIFELAFNA